MRTSEADRMITKVDGQDDLLTTGEAAAILGSTRQHVGNLIKRGDITSTLVGKHYRVRRSDVEMLKQSSIRLTRDRPRSWRHSHRTASLLASSARTTRSPDCSTTRPASG
jgi:excisionase family DNA binding protein